jgi:hypothetical protein
MRGTKQALHHKKKQLTGVAMLPYRRSISDKISRLLDKYHMKAVHILARKTCI